MYHSARSRRMRLPAPVLAIACSLTLSAAAGEANDNPSTYDRLWDHAALYNKPGTGILQSLSLSGRLQAEAAWFDTDQGDLTDQAWRRFRFGFKAQFSNDWGAHLEADLDLNESAGDWYRRLTDAYASWEPNKALHLKILKQSAGFTLDGATSSKNLLALERSNLTDNLWFSTEYFSGVSLAGASGDRWSYKAGIFSNDGDAELGTFDAGYFTLASVERSWAKELRMKDARLALDYVYQSEESDNNTPAFANVVSLNSRWEEGRWGLWTDASAGLGYDDQRDVWGATLMPFYNLGALVQLVLRYTYIASDGDNGVHLPRYHEDIVAGRGDEYNEIYAGLNRYFYGHKLKWQTGIQYADMGDSAGDGGATHGWGLTTGLRAFW